MNKKVQFRKSSPLQEISGKVVQVYLFLMLGVFPLYFQDKYYNIGDAKYSFFRTVTLLMLVVLGLCLFYVLMIPEGDVDFGRLSAPDIAVLAYAAAALISWVLSPFKENAWIGSHEWYMGLLSQLLFVGIYFAISRYAVVKKGLLMAAGVANALVFLIAYLHRFRIDPLGFYEGISERYQILFLGTIGQASWYSSYLAVVLPVMMGIYMVAGGEMVHKKNDKHLLAGISERFMSGVLLFLGFGTAVTQNSDSIYIGAGLAFAFLLWFALENLTWWKRFVEIVLVALLSAKITGLLQLAFPERMYALEPISIAITQGKATWFLLIAVLMLYIGSCRIYRKRKKEGREREELFSGIRKIRWIVYGLLLCAVLTLPILMWLHTTGKITSEAGLLSQSGYLVFDDNWGNARGRTWKYAFRILKEFPLVNKFFGCGPDSMCFYTAVYHQAEVDAMWGGLALTNAHNEWLTALVNYGIVGAAAYVSVFVFSVVSIIRNWKEEPLMLAAGAAILSYAGHNFFCYQQAVCTPLIFIVLGTAEYLRVRKK